MEREPENITAERVWEEVQMIVPLKPGFLRSGLRHPPQRAYLRKFLQIVISKIGLSLDLEVGIYTFLVGKNITSELDLVKTIGFLIELQKIVGEKRLYAGKDVKYLSSTQNLETLFEQFLFSARFFVDKFGIDFFTTRSKKFENRDQVMTANIPGTDMYLSCKGGTGSGVFSIDFAIGAQSERDIGYGGEFWRTGLDVEKIPKGLCVRIVRTGSALKPNLDSKIKAFKEGKANIKITPARALAFLCAHIAYDLGAAELKALTTDGAIKLSSLGRSSAGFDYTSHFKQVGFEDSNDPNWLAITDFQNRYYHATTGDEEKATGLRNFEIGGLNRVFKAFKHLKDPRSGKTIPLTIFGSETKDEIERALISSSASRGRFGWNANDLMAPRVAEM